MFRPEPGVPIVIPERLVGDFLRVMEAARAMHHSAVTVSINILLDGLEESHPDATRSSCATATATGRPGTLEVGELLSATQAAQLLGCTPQAIRKVCGRQRLPAEKVAGVWMIRPDELDRYRFRRK